MASKHLCRGVLVVVLSLVLAQPVYAQAGSKPILSTGAIVGIVAGGIAVVLVIPVVVYEVSKKRTITGCVVSGAIGMTIVDEKDKRTYRLSGDTTGIKLGDRMKLQGKKVKSKEPGETRVWEARRVTKDFGVCQP